MVNFGPKANQIVALRLEGLAFARIAEKAGCSRGYAYQAWERYQRHLRHERWREERPELMSAGLIYPVGDHGYYWIPLCHDGLRY